MKKPTNVSHKGKPRNKKLRQAKKLTYAQQKFKGTIKSKIGTFKAKIWPNQAIQDINL